MSSRDEALERLKKQIADQKSRLNPRVLEKVAQAVQGPAPDQASVPYDTKSAAKAIELFLQGHSDAEKFKNDLIKKMQKETH